MADKNLDIYLNEQDAEYKAKLEKIKKRKKRFKIKSIIFAVTFAVLVIGIYAIDATTRDTTHNELMNASTEDEDAMNGLASSLENLKYPDLLAKYESGYLGNKTTNALNYGFIAENQYGYTSIRKNGDVVFHDGKKTSTISPNDISQINITKDAIIYRGEDRKIYSCKHDGTDKKAIVYDKVGMVVVAGDYVYYVDYSKQNYLYRYSLTDEKTETVIESAVNKFIVVADSILFTDYSNNLFLQGIGSSVTSWSDSNVAKFYFNGEVYIQNNSEIIKFNVNNHFPETVVEGVDELLGVSEKCVYYTADGKLYSQNIETGEKKKLSYTFDYYKGVYNANGKIKALGGDE